MAIGIVGNPFDDNAGNLIPNAGTFHLEGDDVVLFGDLVTVFARFYHRISRGDTPNENFGAIRLLRPQIPLPFQTLPRYQLALVAAELGTGCMGGFGAVVLGLLTEVARPWSPMFMPIRRREQLVFGETGIAIVALTLVGHGGALKTFQIFGGVLPQALFFSLGFKDSDEAADVFVGSAETVLNCVLRNGLAVILPAEVVLKNNLADDHIAQQHFVRAWAGHAATNSHEKGKL